MDIHESTSEGFMPDEERAPSRPERPAGFYELRRIVAANIRDHRILRGWSLDGLAERLAPYLGRMGAPAISAWESSRFDGAKGFTVEELYALARVFEIQVPQLLVPPRQMDMEPITHAPGEDNPRRIADVWGMDDDGVDEWRRWLVLNSDRLEGSDGER